MYDPVTVPTDQNFERTCIEACRQLNYIPSSFPLQPNDDLKSTILDWCNSVGHPHPCPISGEEAHNSAKRCMVLHELFWRVYPKVDGDGNGSVLESSKCIGTTSILESSYSRILEGSIAHPSFSSKGIERSSETANVSFEILEKIKNLLMKLEVKKIPSKATASLPTCLASSETVEKVSNNSTCTVASPFEVEILKKLNDAEISVREQALVTLHEYARESRDNKISLCNHRILGAVLPKLHHRHPPIIIIRATAFLVSLSAEPSNRFKIARSNAIQRLVSVLNNRGVAASDLAALSLSKLALEKNNWKSIGATPEVMSAPVEHFCETAGNYKGRKCAGTALYQLSLSFPDNLMSLAKVAGAV